MDQKVNVKLLFFGVAKELAKRSEADINIQAEWKTVNDLIKYICEEFDPNLSALVPIIALALNEEYLIEKNESIKLEDNYRLAIIPPINGG